MAQTKGLLDRGALKKAFSPPTVVRSLIVAAIVGVILNVINQGAEIVGGKPPDVIKLLLTFAVPFLVASFGAYSAYTAREESQPYSSTE